MAEKTYKDSFDDELEQFKARIKKRAAEKIQEALREQEEEERKARLGPGGLDPVEVYEELPEVSGKQIDLYIFFIGDSFYFLVNAFYLLKTA